jgi:hypothetical protein
MKKGFPFFILIVLLISCNKEEKNDLVWEKSSGKGSAYFIQPAADSGFIAGGQVDGKQYLVKYNSKRDRLLEITTANTGLFSAAWSDTASFITAGCSNGKLILNRFDREGVQDWEKVIDAQVNLEIARLRYTGNGKFLAMATPDADSLNTGDSGLLFASFDTSGTIVSQKVISGSGYISSLRADFDNSGNIYLAITRKTSTSKSKASVAKFSSDFNKLWETELFNNPGFSSASMGIKYLEGYVFVTGRTEVPSSSGTMMNSFVVSLNDKGQLSDKWSDKKYPEFYNEGSDIDFDSNGNLLVLNRKCFIVNVFDPDNVSSLGTIRTFSVCVSETSGARAFDMDSDYSGNILLAGSLDGNFFVAIKSPLQ